MRMKSMQLLSISASSWACQCFPESAGVAGDFESVTFGVTAVGALRLKNMVCVALITETTPSHGLSLL